MTGPVVGEPAIVVVADPDEAAGVAAERVAHTLTRAIAVRDRADWATTGGSTPAGIYRRLIESPLADTVRWSRVHVWLGDDRFVPRDHPLSNALPFDDILLDPDHGVVIPPDNLHPFRTSEAIGAGWDAAWAATTLASELRAADLPLADGWPVLDLVLAGIGADGHILSVFPGSATFDATDWALPVPAPTHIEPHVERVTLNPAILRVARDVLVVATGAAKAAVIGEILGPSRDEHRWPAQLARRAGAAWILDTAAAARLRR